MKKVLIITYYWPPCGGIGVLRCLKFAKYLRQFGWEPIIFTADDAHYPSLDHSNDKDIPEGITILKQKIWEPYHIYKYITGQKPDANVNNVFYASEKKAGFMHNISVWIRSNFFIPDARALWIKPSVKYLSEYLKQNPVDAIISNGPPHSNTRIATLIKKETDIPWLADFQDPWSQVDYFSMLKLTKWGLRKHLKMEQEVFQFADAISIVSPTWKGELEKIGAKDVQVLPWGYDHDDFKDLKPLTTSGFTCTHTGILGIDRNPTELWEALKILETENPALYQQFSAHFIGLVDKSIKEESQKRGFEKKIKITGAVERKTALAYTLGSSILLLVLNRQENAAGRIPGKLFEYLASGRPILAIGPPESDVAILMKEAKAGFYVAFEDINACKDALVTYFEAFKTNSLKGAAIADIQAFSNKTITQNLANLLNFIRKNNSG
jgi:glycosyltransferase involved in cell wall biosynthesis